MNILQRSLRERFPRLSLLLSPLLLLVPRLNRCLSPVASLVGQDCRPVPAHAWARPGVLWISLLHIPMKGGEVSLASNSLGL